MQNAQGIESPTAQAENLGQSEQIQFRTPVFKALARLLAPLMNEVDAALNWLQAKAEEWLERDGAAFEEELKADAQWCEENGFTLTARERVVGAMCLLVTGSGVYTSLFITHNAWPALLAVVGTAIIAGALLDKNARQGNEQSTDTPN